LHGIREYASLRPVIVSFGDLATEAVFHGRRDARTRRIPSELLPAIRRKLDMLNAAHDFRDLRVPPGNRLEGLQGDRKGYHSIRVNDQWRLIFRWTAVGPERVSLIDYH
jgi:proteic killer suppression protein